jgi:hypothetical protein
VRTALFLLLTMNATAAFAQYYFPEPDYSAQMNQLMSDLQAQMDAYNDSMERIQWTASHSHWYQVVENPLRVRLNINLCRTAPWYDVSGTIENAKRRNPLSWDKNGGLSTAAAWPLDYGDRVVVCYSGGNSKYANGVYQFTVGVDDAMTREQWNAQYSHGQLLARKKANAKPAGTAAPPAYPVAGPAPMPPMPGYTPMHATRSRAEILYDIQRTEELLNDSRRNMQSSPGLATTYGYSGIIARSEQRLMALRQELAQADH